jgi:hypothetical protein
MITKCFSRSWILSGKELISQPHVDYILFTFGLFNDDVNISDCITSGDRMINMNNELERI